MKWGRVSTYPSRHYRQSYLHIEEYRLQLRTSEPLNPVWEDKERIGHDLKVVILCVTEDGYCVEEGKRMCE